MKGITAKAVICVILGNVIWGFGFLFTKIGLEAAPDPNVMLAHRFLLSTLLMSVSVCTGKEKVSFKGKDWKPLGALLLMQLLYYVFESYGILHTNATIAGLVLAVVPVVTIGTEALFLRTYPTRRQAIFCIMPVAGVIIMTVSGKELGVVTIPGILFLVLTTLASAGYKTANRKAAAQFTSFERTYVVLAISAVVFSVVGMGAVNWDLGAFVAPLWQGKYLLSILCLSALSSIVANLLVNYAAGHMSAFKLSSFGSLSTLCTMLAGVVFLKEPISISLVLGAVLILVGIRQVTKPN